jgi:hypothetical protein
MRSHCVYREKRRYCHAVRRDAVAGESNFFSIRFHGNERVYMLPE